MNYRPLDESIAFVFPFRQIMCPGTACASHAALDGFIAPREDEVWQYILPPNGPNRCYCTILNLIEQDVPPDDAGRLPGVERLPKELLERCRRYK